MMSSNSNNINNNIAATPNATPINKPAGPSPLDENSLLAIQQSATAPPIPYTNQQVATLGTRNTPSPLRTSTPVKSVNNNTTNNNNSNIASPGSASSFPKNPPPSQPPSKSRPASPSASSSTIKKIVAPPIPSPSRSGATTPNRQAGAKTVPPPPGSAARRALGNDSSETNRSGQNSPVPRPQQQQVPISERLNEMNNNEGQKKAQNEVERNNKNVLSAPTLTSTSRTASTGSTSSPKEPANNDQSIPDDNLQQSPPQQKKQNPPSSKSTSRTGSTSQQQQNNNNNNNNAPMQPSPLVRHKQRAEMPSSNAVDPPKKKLVDPKILPPAPSFEQERLALLRHLKEMPAQVSHATSTDQGMYNESDFDDNQEDNVMSSTLVEEKNNNNNNSKNDQDGFHVSSPPPKKEVAKGKANQYALAYNEALSSSRDLETREQENQADEIPVARKSVVSSTNNFNNNNSNNNVFRQQISTLQSYLFLRDLEVEELTFRSQLSEHAATFLNEIRSDFWKAIYFNNTIKFGPRSSNNQDGALTVSDQSVQSLVLALDEAQAQSAHAADRLQETYDVLDRMATELSDSRSTTLQIQAELTHAREVHAAAIEQMRLDQDIERDSWSHRAEEKFMKRVKKLASRVASQEQELIELRGAIASLRYLAKSAPGGSELALKVVEDALNVKNDNDVSSSSRQQYQNPSALARYTSYPQQQQQQRSASKESRHTNVSQQQQLPQTPAQKVASSGTRRLIETGVLDAESATVKRLIEKGYLSPP